MSNTMLCDGPRKKPHCLMRTAEPHDAAMTATEWAPFLSRSRAGPSPTRALSVANGQDTYFRARGITRLTLQIPLSWFAAIIVSL
jgi:hypothetical protein